MNIFFSIAFAGEGLFAARFRFFASIYVVIVGSVKYIFSVQTVHFSWQVRDFAVFKHIIKISFHCCISRICHKGWKYEVCSKGRGDVCDAHGSGVEFVWSMITWKIKLCNYLYISLNLIMSKSLYLSNINLKNNWNYIEKLKIKF